MGSLDPVFIEGIDISPRQASVLKRLGEYVGMFRDLEDESAEVLEDLKRLAKIESIESSNRLEGIVVDQSRIEEISLKNSALRGRSEQEVAGYRDALDMIHLSHDEIELSLELIRDLHEMIYHYTDDHGGKWKDRNNYIIERAGGMSRIRFRPTPASETPRAMERLMEEWEMADSQGFDPMITIPLFVLDFLCIHPFSDGNGRCARLITLFLLYRKGFHVGRYISLERVIEDLKGGYYDDLYISSQGWHGGKQDVGPWMEYVWTVLLRAYRELDERMDRVQSKGPNKTMRVRRAALSLEDPFSISEVRRECPDVSRDMVRHVLRQMRDEGVIKAIGIGRGARWVKTQDPDAIVGS